MKILHLSDTPLSGAPIRIVELLRKYTPHEAHHIVWDNVPKSQPWRKYRIDMVGSVMRQEELADWFGWADVIHYHNRFARQKIFNALGNGFGPPKVPSVIQIHSPRESEDFSEELASGLPLAIVGQYHPRQWMKELTYIVPNVVDIHHPEFKRELPPLRPAPVVSYSPSSCNGRGWDDKSYSVVAPLMKRLHLAGRVYFQLIIQQPYEKVIEMKRNADIGIDEVSTGSYHLSSLEFLAMGIPCFANVDQLTFDIIKKMTGATKLPWIIANKVDFPTVFGNVLREKKWQELGAASREWMEKYWTPEFLSKQYVDMYEDL